MKKIINKKFTIIGLIVGLIMIIGTLDSPTLFAGFQYPFLSCYVGYVIDQFKAQINRKKILTHTFLVSTLIGANIYFSKKFTDQTIERHRQKNEEMKKNPHLFLKKNK